MLVQAYARSMDRKIADDDYYYLTSVGTMICHGHGRPIQSPLLVCAVSRSANVMQVIYSDSRFGVKKTPGDLSSRTAGRR
jgi:hypothetical protein